MASVISRATRIKTKLQTALQATLLEVEDVSYQHAGHAAMRQIDGGANETHFNLKIVSSKFEGQNLVKRHRVVYEILSDELQSGLHALSINAKTPKEAGIAIDQESKSQKSTHQGLSTWGVGSIWFWLLRFRLLHNPIYQANCQDPAGVKPCQKSCNFFYLRVTTSRTTLHAQDHVISILTERVEASGRASLGRFRILYKSNE